MNYSLPLNKLKSIFNPFESELSVNLLLDYITNPSTRKLEQHPLDDKDKLYKDIANYIINSDSQKSILIDLNNTNPIINGYFEYVKSIYNNDKNIYISIPKSDDKLDVNNIFVKKLSIADNIEPYSDYNNLLINENFKFESSIWNTQKDIYSDIEYILPELLKFFDSYEKTRDNNQKNDYLRYLDDFIKKIPPHIFENVDFQSKILKAKSNFYFSYLINHIKFDFNHPSIINAIDFLFSNHNFDILNSLRINKLINQPIIDLINKKDIADYLILNNYYSSYSNDSLSLEHAFSYLSDDNKKNPLYLEKFIQSCIDKSFSNRAYLKNDDIIAQFDMSSLYISSLELLIPFYSNEKINRLKYKFKDNPLALDNINKFNNLLTLDFFKSHPNLSQHSFNYVDNFFKSADDISIDDVKFFISNKIDYSNINNHPLFKKFKFNLELEELNISLNSKNKLSYFDFRSYIHYFSQTNNDDLEKFKSKLIIANKIADRIHLYETNPAKSKIIFNKYCTPEYLFITEKNYSFFNPKNIKPIGNKNLEFLSDMINKMKSLEFSSYSINYDQIYLNVNKKLKSNIHLIELLNYNVSFNLLSDQLKYNKKVLFNYLSKNITLPDNLLNYLFTDKKYLLDFFSMVDNHQSNIEKAPINIQKFFINNNIKENYLDFFNKYLNYVELNNSIAESTVKKSNKNKL